MVPSSSSWLYGVLSLSFLISSWWNENPCSLFLWKTFFTLEFRILWRFPLQLPLSFDERESWKDCALKAVKNTYCSVFSYSVRLFHLWVCCWGFLFVLSDQVSRWYMIIAQIFFDWQPKAHKLCPIQSSYMLSGRKMFSMEIIWSWKGWLNIWNLKHGHNDVTLLTSFKYKPYRWA